VGMVGVPSSCALLGRFTIGARVFRCCDNIHVCKRIAFTANAYSAEREMSVSACTHSVAGIYFW